MKRPTIGLTLDSEPAGGYSNQPWYALRENYCGAVVRAGGLPLLLPHEPGHAADYLDRVDGLIVTGGAFDVDPALFGAATRHETVTTKDRRTEFEKSATEGALERDMPVLGICGGQQLLNVVLGGTLIQHVPSQPAKRDCAIRPQRAANPPPPVSAARLKDEPIITSRAVIERVRLSCASFSESSSFSQAIMRTLIIFANVLVRDDREWAPSAPATVAA